MTHLTQPRGRLAAAATRALVAIVPWALLLLYSIANSTVVGESTDWGEVARMCAWASAPLALAVVAGVLQPSLRSVWRGWTGVLLSWAVAFAAFVVVWSTLGPFI